MDKSQDAKATDRTAKTERSEPMPLADRHRLMRPKAKPVKSTQVITDWASI